MSPHNMECEFVFYGWRVAGVEGTKGRLWLADGPPQHGMRNRAWRVAGGGCGGDEGRLWLAGDDELPWIA